VLLSLLRQPEAALPLLEKAYALDPISPALIVTIGQALFGLGRLDEAMEIYEKVLEIEPAYASTYYLIGSLHANGHGRLDHGVHWGLESAMRDPRYVTNLSALGSYYLALGDPAQAEYWIDRALSAGPDRYASNAARTFLHFYKGEAADALNMARALHEIAPGNNVSLYMLVANARYGEALSIAAAHYPEFSCDGRQEVTRANLFPAINISLALEEIGNRECATRLLDAAVERMQMMPRFGYHGYGFADVEAFARQGEIDRAIAVLRQAIDQGLRNGWWTQLERSPHVMRLTSSRACRSRCRKPDRRRFLCDAATLTKCALHECGTVSCADLPLPELIRDRFSNCRLPTGPDAANEAGARGIPGAPAGQPVTLPAV
jgi:tetratricopeptide (TPR) repeat protein